MSATETDDAVERVRRLLIRADDLRKAAPQRSQPEAVREQLMQVLDAARDELPAIADGQVRRTHAAAIARRISDLDLEALAPMLEPTSDVSKAPTTVDDPSRVPPGQHLTAGWPILHVGAMPAVTPQDVKLTVTGHVNDRVVLDLAELQALGPVTVTRDFHCVTRWSRLDNTWTGVPVSNALAIAGIKPSAQHAVITGSPAYSTNLDLQVLQEPDVLLAWEHDGQPLAREHGGPLRLVVPSRYGWKSVKWVFEIRLTERDVPGYWEERGYHDVADPWLEQRFRDDG